MESTPPGTSRHVGQSTKEGGEEEVRTDDECMEPCLLHEEADYGNLEPKTLEPVFAKAAKEVPREAEPTVKPRETESQTKEVEVVESEHEGEKTAKGTFKNRLGCTYCILKIQYFLQKGVKPCSYLPLFAGYCAPHEATWPRAKLFVGASQRGLCGIGKANWRQ